jgi:hypothetical protein
VGHAESRQISSRGFSNGWHDVLLYSEHTWGAHNSISDPDLPEVKEGKWCFTQLFVNNRRRPRTRLPKDGFYRVAELIGATNQTPWSQGQNEFRFNTGEIKAAGISGLSEVAMAGVSCDMCHSVSGVTHWETPSHEPENGSFILTPGVDTKDGLKLLKRGPNKPQNGCGGDFHECVESGLHVDRLSESVLKKLEEMRRSGDLLSIMTGANPVDLSGQGTSEMFARVLRVLMDDAQVDSAIVMAFHHAPPILDDAVKAIADTHKGYSKPVSDAAHEAGMRFLLWFEPERVGDPGSWLGKNHPEWLLPGTSHGALLDEGNPEARNWLIKNTLDRLSYGHDRSQTFTRSPQYVDTSDNINHRASYSLDPKVSFRLLGQVLSVMPQTLTFSTLYSDNNPKSYYRSNIDSSWRHLQGHAGDHRL